MAALSADLSLVEKLHIQLDESRAETEREKKRADKNAREIEKYKKLANTDALTRMPNRRFLKTQFKHDFAYAKRDGLPLSGIMIDVDHFKSFNETHGYKGGDKVLRHVGSLLCKGHRAEDTAARLGGEEFVIILPGCSLADAEKIADELRRKIEKATCVLPNKKQVRVTASFGVTEIDHAEGKTPMGMMRRMNKALKHAKENGRNIVGATTAKGEVSLVCRNQHLKRKQKPLLGGGRPKASKYELALVG